MKLNMSAIQEKSTLAQEKAKDAIFWIVFTGILCFVIALVLFLSLPGNIANPISELTESIQQIAAKNYSQRVHLDKQNEFE